MHQIIDRRASHKNDPENFIDINFYQFNKVRIYVKGKLALENILPYVYNTQYYVNYIDRPKFDFYTSKPGGIDESLEVLEKQINKALTSKNTYVVFCIESQNLSKVNIACLKTVRHGR